jgi:hypothetical protein
LVKPGWGARVAGMDGWRRIGCLFALGYGNATKLNQIGERLEIA